MRIFICFFIYVKTFLSFLNNFISSYFDIQNKNEGKTFNYTEYHDNINLYLSDEAKSND